MELCKLIAWPQSLLQYEGQFWKTSKKCLHERNESFVAI
jgi:hypothetical protein